MRATLALLLGAANMVGAQTFTVRGLAYDSLSGAPMPNAYVAIPRLHRSATADSLGRFTFDSVASGTYTFYVQHDALDAIGMTDITRDVAVGRSEQRVVVGVPSFAALWRQMCDGAPPNDSAIVFGAVTGAKRRPAGGAAVAITWLDLVVQNKKTVSQHQRVGRVVTDSAGRYALCGVPLTTGLTLRATQDSLDSGVLELLPLQRGVLRRDIQLNARNAATTGVVTGTVTLEGREPTGARVFIEGLPEVRVGADGKFTLRNVPVGSHAIEATFVGMAPVMASVDVAPGAITTLELDLKKVVALPGVTVTESAVRMQIAREFDQRRAEGLGRYADSTQIARYASLESFFQDVPFTFVKGAMGKRAIYIGNCTSPARLIVDGIVTSPGDFTWRDQRDIAAVETYDHVVPMEFQAKVGKPCGLVVVWTKARFP